MENSGFSLHPFHCVAQLIPQLWEVKTAQIAQPDPFNLLPEALRRIIGQEVLDELTAMNRGAIPNDYHPARHLTKFVGQGEL
jgi:hypothetical protein